MFKVMAGGEGGWGVSQGSNQALSASFAAATLLISPIR